MQTEGTISTIATVLPEGYVDLVRRVAPGATLLLAFSFLTGLVQPTRIGIWDITVFLLLSYVVGMALDVVCECIPHRCSVKYASRFFCSKWDVMKVVEEVLKMSKEEVKQKRRTREIPALIRLHVIENNRRAEVLLPKLVAEEFLYRNLALGILLMAILFALMKLGILELPSSPGIIKTQPLLIGALFFVFEALVLAGALRRARRTATRTLEWFRLLHKEEFAAVYQNRKQACVPAGGDHPAEK